MTAEASKANAEARAKFTDKFGACAIEAGVVGNLADHECRHGNLPTDPPPKCACFTRKRKR